MKMVEFTRDMRPHRTGETRIVPDEVANKLIAEGSAKPRDSVFDKTAQASSGGKPYRIRKRK